MFDCFLANTFTAVMVKDMMPVSSDTIPVMTKFMLMCMGFIYLSMLSSAFSLVSRMRVKMPPIIRKIFIETLGPLLLVAECSTACKQYCKVNADDSDDEGFPLDELPSPRIPWHHQTSDSDFDTDSYEPSFSSGYPGTSENSYRVDKTWGFDSQDDIFAAARSRVNFLEQPFSSGYNSLESQPKPTKHQKACLRNIETLVNGVKQEIEDENMKDFWDFVSKIADRIFLGAFVFTWITMALALFLKVPSRSGSGI